MTEEESGAECGTVQNVFLKVMSRIINLRLYHSVQIKVSIHLLNNQSSRIYTPMNELNYSVNEVFPKVTLYSLVGFILKIFTHRCGLSIIYENTPCSPITLFPSLISLLIIPARPTLNTALQPPCQKPWISGIGSVME